MDVCKTKTMDLFKKVPIFEPMKVHTYGHNIWLIRLFSLMLNYAKPRIFSYLAHLMTFTTNWFHLAAQNKKHDAINNYWIAQIFINNGFHCLSKHAKHFLINWQSIQRKAWKFTLYFPANLGIAYILMDFADCEVFVVDINAKFCLIWLWIRAMTQASHKSMII